MTLRDDFAAVVARGSQCDLARGALTLARLGYPDLDATPYLARLDALAAEARAHLPGGRPAGETGLALAAYLFRDLGFRGNEDDYYDPRNSFLNDVLERRTGIPISLSVVLLETAGRLGLPAEGVGFPGHFLVRIDTVLLDPFFGGRPIGPDELLHRYQALRRDAADALPPDALAPADRPAILARMLRNLVQVYLDRKEHTRALEAVDLFLIVVPHAADELRLRGLLYEQLECPAAAVADFRRYLELAPAGPDARDIRDRMVRLARTATTVH